MFCVYHFNLTLLPPRIVEVGNIPSFHDPIHPHISLRIIGPKAPTSQPSPSISPTKIKKTAMMSIQKSVKMKKGKETDLVDSQEEVRGGRRRFERLAKKKANRPLSQMRMMSQILKIPPQA